MTREQDREEALRRKLDNDLAQADCGESSDLTIDEVAKAVLAEGVRPDSRLGRIVTEAPDFMSEHDAVFRQRSRR
jgi:hypothetical protein